ncbi:glycosyltransferase family 2 protein [Pseudarthrobacter sp. L1SW]|uniref:glycosyltransferase family 2 protein n=1 Tax=Pseudarthrobacter sp. L1SW TaxID=2851598 RepID=UPI00351D8072
MANHISVEHVIMDGSSTDGTQNKLAAYGDKIAWCSEDDNGQSDALNKALDRAAGEVVGWLNADDFYLPGALDRVAQEFSADPSLDVLYGDTVLVDGKGKVMRLYKCYDVPDSVLRWRGCTLMSTSTFFRKSVLGSAPFDSQLRMRMDWDLFLRLRQDSAISFKYVSEPFAAFRFHEEQVTHNQVAYNTSEHLLIRSRYNIRQSYVPVTRRLGITIHRVLKAVKGSWFAERKSAKLAGLSLLDGEGLVDQTTLAKLRSLCYP